MINQLCDRALQRGYLSQTFGIDSKFAWEAIVDLDLTPSAVASVTTQPETTSTPGAESPSVSAPEPLSLVPRPAVIIPVADESQSGLRQFAVETEPHVADVEPVDRGPAPRAWGRVAAVVLLTIATSAGGAIWYLSGEPINGSAVITTPPPPPTPPNVIQQPSTPPVTDAPAASPEVRDDAVAPVVGAAPVEGEDHLIQIAFFARRERAANLVTELTTAGYRAREVERDFGPQRGRLRQVIVGGYSSALEVERDLRQIRELPAYSDAHLIAR